MSSSLNSNTNLNINNLNIITFIKDIYLSLKHLDICFSTFKTDIDGKMNKLDEQYKTILEKLSQLETNINHVNERIYQSSNMNSEIEKELLDKIYKLSSTAENSARLELKTKDMTIANILENNYTMLDINNSLETNLESGKKILTEYQPIDISQNIENNTLDYLLFG